MSMMIDWPKFSDFQKFPQVPSIPMIPVGCICPPGANRECERPGCPRKPPADKAAREARKQGEAT